MATVYAKIEGTIVTKEVRSPDNGQTWKPFLSIQVLQKLGEKAALIPVKDYNLNREYNGKFSENCSLSSWAGKNGSAGLNVTVL